MHRTPPRRAAGAGAPTAGHWPAVCRVFVRADMQGTASLRRGQACAFACGPLGTGQRSPELHRLRLEAVIFEAKAAEGPTAAGRTEARIARCARMPAACTWGYRGGLALPLPPHSPLRTPVMWLPLAPRTWVLLRVRRWCTVTLAALALAMAALAAATVVNIRCNFLSVLKRCEF
jgi:hypothetical protein